MGSVNTPGSASRIALAGNYAYVADGTSGLRVVNVSDPADPVLVGGLSIPSPYAAYSVQVGSAGLPVGLGGDDHRYRYARWDGTVWVE